MLLNFLQYVRFKVNHSDSEPTVGGIGNDVGPIVNFFMWNICKFMIQINRFELKTIKHNMETSNWMAMAFECCIKMITIYILPCQAHDINKYPFI